MDVDDSVVDDDMRERIKTRIEEEIWQKLKVCQFAALQYQSDARLKSLNAMPV